MMLPILAIAGIANAQTEGFSKGSIFATGSIGFSSEKEPDGPDDIKTTQFSFSPKVGYFVTSNVAVGLQLGIGSGKTDYGTYEVKETSFSIGAFGRYYFTPANKFSMFLNLGFNIEGSKTDDGSPVDEKYKGFNAGFAPGFNYFITNRLALEASVGVLGFRSTKPDVDDADATTNFDFGVGLNDINFGLVYKFK